MSLPHLLLVDDSEAVLAYERAALSRHYTISTAANGREALERIHQLRPAAVLLDLSMPELDGDEVLRILRADPDRTLAQTPVLIVSSERSREAACLALGAQGFVHKPIRGEELLPRVERLLEEARRVAQRGSLAVLFVGVGPLELGIPLERVRMVVHQPTVRALPGGNAYLSSLFDLHGQPVFILDLAARLGVEHSEPMAERKLVVMAGAPSGAADDPLIALCVDRVRDPEELLPDDVTPRAGLAGAAGGLLAESILAVVRTPTGPVPVVDPEALLNRSLLRRLPKQLDEARTAGEKSP